MIIYLLDYENDKELIKECEDFKKQLDDEGEDLVFQVYKSYTLATQLNEMYQKVYHDKVKDGERRPVIVSTKVGGQNYFKSHVSWNDLYDKLGKSNENDS